MQFPTWRRWQGISIICLLFDGLAGCRGIDEVALKEKEIEQLKYENARKRESLIENLASIDQARDLVHDLETESSSLQKQVMDLGAHLRFANEQVSGLTAQRDSLRTKLAESESNGERLQQSIDKVKSVASASAVELAELSLKRQDLEELVKNLTQRENATATENASVSREVEQLRAELVKTRAVVRSLQAGTPAEDGVAAPLANDGRLETLEREIAGLKGENASLRRRVESLSVPGSVSTPPQDTGKVPPPPAKTAGVGRDNPAGLVQELGALLEERYRSAIRGEMRWDSTDLVLTGCVALVLLLFLWAGVRWIRMHRFLRQIHHLSARVQELESSATQVATEPVGGEGPLPAGAPRGETGSGRARRSPGVRRTGFSAVISNKGYAPRAPSNEPAETEVEELESSEEEPQEVTVESRLGPPHRSSERPSPEDDPLSRILDDPRSRKASFRTSSRPAEKEKTSVRSSTHSTFVLPAQAGGGVSSRPVRELPSHAPLEPRKVIGARSWEEAPREPSEELGEDDQANTQIIPRMVDDETPVGPLVQAGARVPSGGGKSSSLPGMGGRPAGAGPQRPRPAEAGSDAGGDDDRELLAELKAVINKKFDELMK